MKIRDPKKAETDTIMIRGNKKLPLINLAEMFLESVVSQILTGFRMIFFIPRKKNL